jgi:hypothetical protein
VNIVEQAAKLFVPGSLSLLVIAAAVGMVLVSLRGRLARVGRTLLIVTAIVYGALSTPAVASLVERPLVHEYAPLDDRAAAAPVPAIVVLGNGVFVRGAEPDIVHVMHLHTAENVIEARGSSRCSRPGTSLSQAASPIRRANRAQRLT